MASDAPPDHFHKPQGFSVSLTVAGSRGGRAQIQGAGRGRQRQHAVRQDLLLQGFRHVRRSVRHSLDGQLPDGRRSSLTNASARMQLASSSAAIGDQQDRHAELRARATAKGARSVRRGGGSSPAPRRIGLQHQFGGFRLGINPAAPVHRARAMKSEYRAARHADASLGTMLSTSVQADRHGPSITTRSPEARTSSNMSRNGPTCPPGLARMRTSALAGELAAHNATTMVNEDGAHRLRQFCYPFRRSPRNVGKPMPAASKPPSTARTWPVI